MPIRTMVATKKLCVMCVLFDHYNYPFIRLTYKNTAPSQTYHFVLILFILLICAVADVLLLLHLPMLAIVDSKIVMSPTDFTKERRGEGQTTDHILWVGPVSIDIRR